jgi:hypothetical protein
MTRKSKYNSADEVCAMLSKKHDCQIDMQAKIVYVLSQYAHSKKNDLGNGSLGKISYLQNYCKYTVLITKEFPRK